MKNPIFKRAPPTKNTTAAVEGDSAFGAPAIRNALIIIALACIIFFLRYARDFLIPMAMAMVFAAVLDPITRKLRSIGINTSIAAGLTVLFALVVISGSIYLVTDDVAAAVEKLPALSQGLKDRAKTEQAAAPSTVTKLTETAKNLEEAASTLSGAPPTATKTAPRVEVRAESRPSWIRAQLSTGSTTVLQVVSQVLLALLITHFILAAGPMLRRKLLRASGNRPHHRALMQRILAQSCKQVQLYVVIMMVTNVAVGLAVWPVFYLLGFEQHGLWALFAAVVHIVPYVGSVAVAAAAAFVTYLESPAIFEAVNVGAIVLVVVSLVATLLSTWLQSRTSRMNQVAVFVGIMFWGWLWGLWGLFLGAPIVVILKVICDNVNALRGAARLLGD
ncbi:MAG: AI-2E family transporter [Burkholderiales bacterium]|nr:AI-2E family transporter [Burkholderiales bacterium]